MAIPLLVRRSGQCRRQRFGASHQDASISFPNRTMMKRFSLALRVLFGTMPKGRLIEGTMLLDPATKADGDSSKLPPFDLAFPGLVADAPPEKLFSKHGFRVCAFPAKTEKCDECGRPCRWLVLELREGKAWFNFLIMQESKLPIMLSVLRDVARYLSKRK